MYRKKEKQRKAAIPTALGVECLNVTRIWLQHGVFGVPFSLLRGLSEASYLSPVALRASVFKNIGERLVKLVAALGPVYGKAAQIGLSRVDMSAMKSLQDMNLDDIYGNWPPMSFEQVEAILEQEIPDWKQHLIVEPLPITLAWV